VSGALKTARAQKIIAWADIRAYDLGSRGISLNREEGSMMRISLLNFTPIPDEEVQAVIRVINRQISEDFEPYWGMGGLLRLEGNRRLQMSMQSPIDMRGDAVLYFSNSTDVTGLLGYHSMNFYGIPYGFVFTWIARQLGQSWTVTLSHEALELIADPETNRLVAGPAPAHPNAQVYYWYEVCDAVETETYQIDGIQVSNFVLPLYFTSHEEPGSRNDFLHRLPPLKSFGVRPGGYTGFSNPLTGVNDAFALNRRGLASARIKAQVGRASRVGRYLSLGTRAGALRYQGR
jgi:hypothetical protein